QSVGRRAQDTYLCMCTPEKVCPVLKRFEHFSTTLAGPILFVEPPKALDSDLMVREHRDEGVSTDHSNRLSFIMGEKSKVLCTTLDDELLDLLHTLRYVDFHVCVRRRCVEFPGHL